MPHAPIHRRVLLASLAAAAGCGRRKATGYAGYALVANRDGNSVAVVDLDRFRVRWRVGLNGAPTQLLAHPSRPAAVALLAGSGAVQEVVPGDAGKGRVAYVAGESVAMRMAPDRRSLWVLCREPASLVELPLDSLRPAGRIRLSANPVDFDFSRDGLAAVCYRDQTAITLANLERSAVERTITLAAPVSAVRFQSDGRKLLAAHAQWRAVTIADVATGRTVVRLLVPLEPRHFCFNADGGQLFVSGPGADAVSIIYPYATEVAETILAGRAPNGMVTSAAPPYLFVTNPETDSITVLDIDTRKLVAVVNVGREPRSIVLTPDNQYALVLNEGSGDLAVVRIPALAARRYKNAPLFTMIPVGARPISAVVVPLA